MKCNPTLSLLRALSVSAFVLASFQVAHAAPVSATPVVDIADIVGAGREAHILHDGQIYRLRITSNRKLILTK